MFKLRHAFVGGMCLLLMPFAASAQESQVIEVYDSKSFEKKFDVALPESFERISFQVADMELDGVPEIIVGSSPDTPAEVIFYSLDGTEKSRWQVYGPGYTGGVNVHVADVDGDGFPNLVLGTRETGGPHVQILTHSGETLSQFFAFEEASRAGISVSGGDIRNDKAGMEILVAHGEGQKAVLKLFTNWGELLQEWYPFGEEYFGGLNTEVAPDGTIVVSRAFGPSPLVRMYDGFGNLTNEILAYYEAFPGGVQAQVMPAGDGWDVFTVPGFSGGPHVRNFSKDGVALSPGFMAFQGEFKGGLKVALGDINHDQSAELFVAKGTLAEGPYDSVKAIKIDLSEQKLYTYDRGHEQESYWISSGTYRFPTPTGDFEISRKREKTRMSWFYGEDSPDNYDLEDVPHALTFYGPYNIHGAYWHNNFGNPMSHGCINMALPDAEELYGWADIGTSVVVQE